MKTKNKWEQLVQDISDRLMTNYKYAKASRLQLRGPNEEDLGGYCRNAVESEVRIAVGKFKSAWTGTRLQ